MLAPPTMSGGETFSALCAEFDGGKALLSVGTSAAVASRKRVAFICIEGLVFGATPRSVPALPGHCLVCIQI